MNKRIITTKVTVRKGELPEEWVGRDWWGPKEWAAHEALVADLQAKGEYLQEEEYTVSYPEGCFDAFNQPSGLIFSNLQLHVPKEIVVVKPPTFLP